MTLEENINQILDNTFAMSLATVDGDASYSVWLHFAREGRWGLVVYSKPMREHSKHIEKNPHVSGAILPQQNPGYGVRGLSFVGRAKRIEDKAKLEQLDSAYAERFGNDPDRLSQAVSNDDNQHTFYRITPSRFILFDTHNFPDNPKQTLEL